MKIKHDACKWADELIPTLPYILAVLVHNRRCWQVQATSEIVTIPTEPGIYLAYPVARNTAVYVGATSDLCRRLTYHTADSVSSHKNSTLKKNLRRDGLWDGKTALEKCVRFRYFTVSFGRTEIEEYLHKKYKINTSRAKIP